MRFIPNNDPVQRAMLREIGCGSLEELFASIPEQARLQRPLNIPPGMAEQAQMALFQELAAKNEGFPKLSGESLKHGSVTLPDDIPAGAYNVILAYRANW